MNTMTICDEYAYLLFALVDNFSNIKLFLLNVSNYYLSIDLNFEFSKKKLSLLQLSAAHKVDEFHVSHEGLIIMGLLDSIGHT